LKTRSMIHGANGPCRPSEHMEYVGWHTIASNTRAHRERHTLKSAHTHTHTERESERERERGREGERDREIERER